MRYNAFVPPTVGHTAHAHTHEGDPLLGKWLESGRKVGYTRFVHVAVSNERNVVSGSTNVQ